MMRGAIGILLLLLASSSDAANYTCPPSDTTPTIITEATSSSGPTTITIDSTTAKSSLCTLTRRQSSTTSSSRRIPVARSYAGREWEKSAGLFARSGSGLVVDCTTAGGGEGGACELTLPSLGEGQEYVLESFSYEVSMEVEAARFLEQATFGPTRESINALVATSNNFASWIHTQMYSTPPSYHREFLRQNTHPKFEYPYLTAAVGPRPCEQYSRWRKYAITSRDIMDDRKSAQQKHLTIEQVEGVSGYLWMVDGTFRTITQDHPTFMDGTTLMELNVRYRIAEVKRSFLVNCIGCKFEVTYNGTEYDVANPAVSIEGVEGNEALLPYSTVTLPAFGSSEFPAVEKASEAYPLFTTWMKDDENGLLDTNALESSTQCDGFPSFRQPEAVAVEMDDAPQSVLPTVFGRSLNSDTGVEEMFAYDPHLHLYENTPENPLPDGGGQLVLDTYDPIAPGKQVLCHNVHRSYDNEDKCQLSYLDTACAPDEKPQKTIVLNGTNLEGINALTGKSLYAVTGLTIDEEVDVEEGELVESVLHKDAALSIQGCNSWSRGRSTKDRNTEKFWCDRTDTQHIPSSVIFSPPKPQLSIVHKLRMYTSNTVSGSDPANWILEGRAKPNQDWELIGSGDFDLPLDRNPRGLPIESTYESGDVNHTFVEVSLANNTQVYWDYKLTIPATRDPTRKNLQFAEVELPGLLLPYFPISHTCTDGAQSSRWKKVVGAETCPNTSNLGEGTYKLFSDLVSEKGDVYNPSVRTVTRQFRECDSSDMYKLDLGMVEASDGTCWKHVHDLEDTIFDLTGADLSNYALTGSVAQVSNAVVDDIVAHPIIGTLGDHSTISSSSVSPLDQQDVQDAFMTLEFNPSREAVLVCGSPGEVATNPFASDHGFDITVPQKDGTRTMSIWELSAQRHTTWAQMAMHAEDQLLQRQSWALSQIIAVGLPGSGRVFYEVNEPYPAFYDQYVRNGFGSYRQLLKGMSFSLIMSEWLTFLKNKSLQHNINNGLVSFPDENYAREIMQLFSIGLYKLNMDGSQVLDENGDPIETYTIDDIMSYAAAWTGFDERDTRGGASAASRHGESTVDPLYIDPETRDRFPKSNLDGGFIGDQVALCNDLPDKAFLRKGATYKLLGSNPTPTMLSKDEAVEDPDRPQMVLLPSSPLFTRLCSQDSNGDCTFPANVVLEDNLFYDEAAKLGLEYKVDTLRTVKLKTGTSHAIYFEYIRQPCVEHSFYNDAKKVIQGEINGDAVQDNVMCADPTLPVATSMCLQPGSEQSTDGAVYCNYMGERMTYDSAIETCAANGLELGEPWLFRKPPFESGPCAAKGSFLDFRSWTNSTCHLKAKVSLDAGKVAIVHSPSPDHGGMRNVEPSVSEASLNLFQTPWKNDNYPSLNDCLSMASCYVRQDEDDYCICEVEVTVNEVFASSVEISSVADLKAALHIGAGDPLSFDEGHFTDLGNCGIDGLTVYSTAGDCTSFTSDTVFSFEWKSKPFFLKNVKSEVYLSGSDFAFRNPVQFTSLVQAEARDMYHETEEVLDSLFYHPSHPPFLAMRLAQRFGLSNASPGLIERSAKAYVSGTFEFSGLQFGSKEYGDLGALIAAILLDPESREAVLDADQSHGQAKAPLDKVIAMFRSMGLKFESPLALPTLLDTFDEIGQGSFQSPSVFNFYLVEYANPGAIQDAGLTSPETSLYQSYRLSYLLDAMSTTVKFGVNDCPRIPRFEGWRVGSPFGCSTIEGNTDFSPAHFSYWPSSVESVDAILEELSLLLTSGRLKASNEALIASLVQPIFETGDTPKAIRAAQQYIMTTPEAHTTGIPRNSGVERQITGYESKPRGPYKALVFLNFAGGVDSFNLIAPKGQCESGGDGYAAYAETRGSAHALPLDGLTSISTSDQVCKEFGVHKDFSLLADYYNETIFFANIGTLNEPLTRHDNWKSGSLFGHNTMQYEMARCDPHDEAPDTGVFGRLLDMLQKQGHHTSANNLNGDKQMLQGFAEFQNTIHEVQLSSPKDLNQYPTVSDLFNVAKNLNGVGGDGNSFFSEAWSESVSAALFEHEQSMAMAAAGIEVTDYPLNGESSLSKGLNAIANHMLSRDFRNVNRDIYVLREGGFDMHKSSEGLALAFADMNTELGKFIDEMKNQGIWQDVAIVFGSEFGRGIHMNSNTGTDHGWAGNSFIIGGAVKGGRVLGKYPHPLNSAHVQYVKGRMIPTTPHEFVWNGVAQWLGVRDGADLDRVLPNSKSFSKCDHFTDKDLFVDGACECTTINGTCSCQCDVVTYPPTVTPTVSPSESPSTEPTTHPSSVPSTSPSVSPTLHPTDHPTADLPDHGALVNHIIDSDSSYTPFGCNSWSRAWAAVDGSLEKYHCDRSGVQNVSAGFTFNAPYVQATIAKKVRVYATDVGSHAYPFDATLEGREDSESPWQIIGSGVLEYSNNSARNPRSNALFVESTYESGDTNYTFAEVNFHSNNKVYSDYRVWFSRTKDYDANRLQLGELEIPGMILPPPPTPPPTLSPSVSPSTKPSVSPTLHPTDHPTVPLPDGVLTNHILDSDSSYTPFGCNSWSRAWAAVDGSLEKYHCDRSGVQNVSAGFTFNAPYVQATIAKKVRVYATDVGSHAYPFDATLEGREDSESPWQIIGSGVLEYSNNSVRNPRSNALFVESTYESGDTNYTFAEVNFHSNNKVYSDYRLSFSRTKDYDANRLQLGEVEIPGMILPPPPTPPPTLSPTVSPTERPTAPPTQPPTPHPTAAVAEGAQAVNSVLYPGTVDPVFGCSRVVRKGHAIAPTTEKFFCDHLDMPPNENGIFVDGFVVSPTHGKLSIAKELRIYTHNNCANCDCVEYLLEGRVNGTSPFEEIGSGEFPWKNQAICRNARGLPINSSFESGDNERCYESVHYPSHATPYLDYKYTCLRTRGNHRYHQIGSLELAGYILN